MQFKITTDYAIRAVLYAAVRKEKLSLRVLANNLNIPYRVLLRLCKELSERGIIEPIERSNNGFQLSRDPSEITLYQIISTFEPAGDLTTQMPEEIYCSRLAVSDMQVRNAYGRLQEKMEEQLSLMTIASLIDPPPS